jgi:hypothetical protein
VVVRRPNADRYEDNGDDQGDGNDDEPVRHERKAVVEVRPGPFRGRVVVHLRS